MIKMNIYLLILYLLCLSSYSVFSQNAGERLLPKECGKPLSCNPFFGAPKIPANAYPWMAAIFRNQAAPGSSPKHGFTCGGTLINNRYVLTGASCLTDPHRLSFIRLGEWVDGTEEDCITTAYGTLCLPRPIAAGIEEILIHPSYNSINYSNDIALIRLNISVNFSSINGLNPICLPSSEFKFRYAADGKRSFAAGWQSPSDGTPPTGIVSDVNAMRTLRSVALPLADDEICQRIYKDMFNPSKQLCVGGKGYDTCYGDGGGPLILPGPSDSSYIQVGIVSFGLHCEINPSVYTSVATYRNWIVENLKP